MKIAFLQPRVSPRLVVVLLWLGCFQFFKFVQGIVSLLAFPFGGGAFHAMFAYSQGGNQNVAILYCGYLFLACLITNALVQFFRVGISWWGLALLGAATAWLAWNEVISWSFPVSAAFSSLAWLLAWCLPTMCFLASFVVHQFYAWLARAGNG